MTYYGHMLWPFLLSLVSFAVLDALWLGVLMKGFYRQHLGHLARMADGGLAPVWPVAALVYPALAIGLTVFVLGRAKSPIEALWLGALFGLVTYGVYDLTNHATLRDWPAVLTVVDMTWGAVICGASGWIVATLVRP